jgi:hypothetical protein
MMMFKEINKFVASNNNLGKKSLMIPKGGNQNP